MVKFILLKFLYSDIENKELNKIDIENKELSELDIEIKDLSQNEGSETFPDALLPNEKRPALRRSFFIPYSYFTNLQKFRCMATEFFFRPSCASPQ